MTAVEDRTTPMWCLREFLRQMDSFVGAGNRPVRDGYAYRSPHGFVLAEGEEFEAAPCPRALAGVPRMCFGNALLLGAALELPYVEGYAYPGRGFPAVHHAWNLLPDGRVLDTTWFAAEQMGGAVEARAYLGVRFSVLRAHRSTWDNDESILDDWPHGYPILREKWAGEESPGDVTFVRAFTDEQQAGTIERIRRQAMTVPSLVGHLA